MKRYLLIIGFVHLTALVSWTVIYVFRSKWQKNFIEWLFFMYLCLILLVFGGAAI